MSQPSIRMQGPFERATREALESVTSASIAREILADALAVAGATHVPEDLHAFTSFVERALRAVVESRLDSAVMGLVLERLGHVLWMATSDVHALHLAKDWSRGKGPRESGKHPIQASQPRALSPIPPRPFAPRATSSAPPEARSDRRITATGLPAVRRLKPTCVLVISLDGTLAALTTTEIAGRCPVVTVGTPIDLARVASRSGDQVVVLVDTSLPSIELPTFIGLVPILPTSTRVVLWGADARSHARLVAAFPQTSAWIPSGLAAQPGKFVLSIEP